MTSRCFIAVACSKMWSSSRGKTDSGSFLHLNKKNSAMFQSEIQSQICFEFIKYRKNGTVEKVGHGS